MESLIRCWKGYVQIQIRGNSPERFMNLCRNRGIILWKIRRQGEYDTCCLALRDVWKLKALVKKSGVSIRIIKKRGIPFFINRNKNRKAAYFSACFSFLGIYLLSLFLWDIQFEGNIHYTDDVLMQFLYENGYVHGMRIQEITCEELEKKIRNQYHDINWVSAMIQGTRLVVKVKENTGVMEIGQEENTPGDLTADREGRIVSIITRAGTPLVHAGDEVKEGDILVSGMIAIKNDAGETAATRQVRADADVIVERQYIYERTFPLEHQVRRYTEESMNYFVRIFDRTFQWLPVKNRDHAEIITEEKQLHLFSNFYLPFYYGTCMARQYDMETAIYDQEEAEALAMGEWETFLGEKKEEGAAVMDAHIDIRLENGSCISYGTVTVQEKTGIVTEIQPDLGEESQ